MIGLVELRRSLQRLATFALGSLLSAGNVSYQAAISFHHNLYAHLKGRTPQMQSGQTGAYYDFRNNDPATPALETDTWFTRSTDGRTVVPWRVS